MSEDSGMSENTKQLVGKAMRSDQRVKAEDLVANELATAVLSEPMPKIRHSCEALMLLSEEEKNSAGISEEEEQEAEKIYQLCQTLQNVFVDNFETEYGHVIERGAAIPWPFPQEEAEEWLDWLDYTTWKIYMGSEDREETFEKARELSEEGKEEEGLYVVSKDRITIDSFNRIKAQFVSWAMPRAAKLLKKIIKLVSSSSFQAAMDRIKGGSSSG